MVVEVRDGETMFPTGVGMNRDGNDLAADLIHVPHRRGDEPVLDGVHRQAM